MAEEALRTRAEGYVVKADAARELLPAIKAALEGKRFVSAGLKGRDFSAPVDERAAMTHCHEAASYRDAAASPEDDYALEDSIPQASLESILCTEELNRRPWRSPDYEKENRALAALVRALADSPDNILQTLAETILEVTQCDSAGLSLLTRDGKTPDVSGPRFYWLVQRIRGRQKLQVDFRSDVASVLPAQVGLSLFRVLQEALHNAVKHSGVRRFEVQLREDFGEIHLVISDSGRGFDVQVPLQGKGLGLTSMRERVRLVNVNGTIATESKPMGGTTIHVRVPLVSEKLSKRATG